MRLLAQRHFPLCIAIAVNVCAVLVLSLVHLNISSDSTEAISVSLGDFLEKNETPAPPSLSNPANQAVLQQMGMALPATRAVTDLVTITTAVPSPISFEVKAPAPAGLSSEALAAMNKANQEFASTASSATTSGITKLGGAGQQSSEIGKGSNVGNGTVNGVKVSRHPGSAKAAGNFGQGWENHPERTRSKTSASFSCSTAARAWNSTTVPR